MEMSDGMASVLFGFPDKGHLWYCATHGDFGWSMKQDEAFCSSEHHYAHHIPGDALEAMDALMDEWDDGEDFDESLSNAQRAVATIRRWDFFDGMPDSFWEFNDEEGFRDLLLRLRISPCLTFLVDVTQALSYYRKYPEQTARRAVDGMPMLVAAQIVGDDAENPQFTVGDAIAEQIEDWLKSQEGMS